MTATNTAKTSIPPGADAASIVLEGRMRIVFCGTAVGAASALRRAYYAGPGNAFWPTLFQVGLIPIQLEPEQYTCITEYGLGLTDLAKTISGSDRVLSRQDFDGDGLREKMRHYTPKVLAFTRKRAAEEFVGRPVEYGRLEDMIGPSEVVCASLPFRCSASLLVSATLA